MAVIRNAAHDDRYIQVGDHTRLVEPGEEFEIDDDLYLEREWPAELFDVVSAPERPDPVEPAGNASTEDWRVYALTQGAVPADVADLGRDELRSIYSTKGN